MTDSNTISDDSPIFLYILISNSTARLTNMNPNEIIKKNKS